MIDVAIMATDMGVHTDIFKTLQSKGEQRTRSASVSSSKHPQKHQKHNKADQTDQNHDDSNAKVIRQASGQKSDEKHPDTDGHGFDSPPFRKSNQEDRVALVRCIVHTADLSGQAMPPEVAYKFGAGVLKEFHSQYQLEVQQGLPLSDYMKVCIACAHTHTYTCVRGFKRSRAKPRHNWALFLHV
jgi:hypothetical protein